MNIRHAAIIALMSSVVTVTIIAAYTRNPVMRDWVDTKYSDIVGARNQDQLNPGSGAAGSADGGLNISNPKAAEAVRLIDRIVHGTRSLYSTRGSYRSISTSQLLAAGRMPDHGIDPWGRIIEVKGTTDHFILEFSQVPHEACVAITEALSAKSYTVDIVCRGGTLKYVAR